MKRYVKKNREKFITEMTKFFQEISCKQENGDYILDACFYKDGVKQPVKYMVRRIDASDGLLSIFGAFDGDSNTFHELKENGFSDINQFTGKYNFHLTDDVDSVINYLKLKFLHLVGKHSEAIKFIKV